MKHRYKQAAALLLALCMVLGLFPGGIVTISAVDACPNATTRKTKKQRI